jgi:hypothetical protein
VSFKRKLTPELTARVGQSVNQQLSNRATAEDKLLAMAARQAAVDPRLTTGMARRRFSRSPGTLRRI